MSPYIYHKSTIGLEAEGKVLGYFLGYTSVTVP